MENLLDLLRNRRSVRKYTDQPLSADVVTQLLEAALMSPSSKRSCSWEFVVIENKATLEQLSHCKEQGAKPIANASLAIVVLGNELASDVWIEDAAIATLLIQLMAEDLGVGSCWIQVRQRYTESGGSSEEYVQDLLNTPPHLRVLSVVTLGHKDETKAPFNPEKLKWEKVHIEHYRHEEMGSEANEASAW